MAAAIIIVFGIGSIIFLSAILLGMAVLLRGQWDTMGQTTTTTRGASASSSSALPDAATGPTSTTPHRPRSPYLDR